MQNNLKKKIIRKFFIKKMSAFFYNNKKSDLNFQGEFSLKKKIKFKSDFFF